MFAGRYMYIFSFVCILIASALVVLSPLGYLFITGYLLITGVKAIWVTLSQILTKY